MSITRIPSTLLRFVPTDRSAIVAEPVKSASKRRSQNPTSRRPPSRRTGPMALGMFVLLAGCKPSNQAPPPPEVIIQQPARQAVTKYLEETGQLAATNSANLVARVQGYLVAIGYADGDSVKKGTPLFTIEPLPYKAQLMQAQANLASAKAKALYSRNEYKRYSTLVKTDAVSVAKEEESLSNRDSSSAAVDQAQAAADQAAITYGYTQITAPFDGVVTAHQASIGSLVGVSQTTALATIVQMDPIWVNFNISEEDVLRLWSPLRERGITARDLREVPIEIGLQGENGYPHSGHLDYVAPQVDSGTGTLAVRGLFDNPQHLLLPGYSVRIRIPLGKPQDALLVPERALGSDQGGRNLMIVNADDVVESRNVTVGTREGDMVVIETGLKPEDRVIVDGQQQAQVGQKVVPQQAAQVEVQDGKGGTP
jgi:RND family efflux transporter MFP subunit